MNSKLLLVLLVLLIIVLVGVYHILDPEKNELNETERAKLGGTYIKLSDGITHYQLEGPDDGVPVVLVHGATVPMWTWDKQFQALKTAGFKVPRFFRIPVLGEFMARLIGIRVIAKRFASSVENNPESGKYTKLFIEQTTYRGFQQSILSMLRSDAVGDYRDSYRIVGNQKHHILPVNIRA